jgi:tRNA A-37 threonylcarbamoyl transferase component Bud32
VKVILTVENGPERGRELIFDKPGQFTLGRGPENHPYRLRSDGLVSRIHFMIDLAPPDAFVKDLSSNGTFVSGRAERIDRHRLSDGDLITAGDTVLRVIFPDAAPLRCVLCGSAGPVLTPAATPQATSAETRAPEKPVFYCNACLDALTENPVLPSGYNLVRKLGKGGLGSVFIATNSRGAERAIKLLLPQQVTDAAARMRFLREATILAQLRHPHIVRYYHLCELDFEKRPGIFCIVMEHFPSQGADALLRKSQGSGLPRALAVTIIEQALAGLAYAHEQGVVHRDVKPGNILVALESARTRVKLCDFGLAKLFGDLEDSVVTLSPNPVGTIFYMAPEQIRDFSHVTPAADIYAMGASLYRLLTGAYAHDFPPEPVSVAHYARVLKKMSVVPIRERDASIPQALAEVVERALAYSPSDRFPTAGAMRVALREAERDASSSKT